MPSYPRGSRRVPYAKLGVHPSNRQLTFRVELAQSPQSQPVEFALTPQQAMILMRTLAAYQKRNRWPIPLIPEIERLSPP